MISGSYTHLDVYKRQPAPHAEILNAAKEVLASKGYELKIVEYTDYVKPNNALEMCIRDRIK